MILRRKKCSLCTIVHCLMQQAAVCLSLPNGGVSTCGVARLVPGEKKLRQRLLLLRVGKHGHHRRLSWLRNNRHVLLGSIGLSIYAIRSNARKRIQSMGSSSSSAVFLLNMIYNCEKCQILPTFVFFFVLGSFFLRIRYPPLHHVDIFSVGCVLRLCVSIALSNAYTTGSLGRAYVQQFVIVPCRLAERSSNLFYAGIHRICLCVGWVCRRVVLLHVPSVL